MLILHSTKKINSATYITFSRTDSADDTYMGMTPKLNTMYVTMHSDSPSFDSSFVTIQVPEWW